MPFQAHHFDDPEQQFDSGKLGMWLFLVTEVLFFSGMFCAYALYRNRNPEVWEFSSQFLNASLGAFNTVVLLFSSLTMAWGVRCAQLRQRTGLVVCLALTLGCASIFLGVKAVEYTHKWDLGLLPAGAYETQSLAAAAHQIVSIGSLDISVWLYRLCIIPMMFVVGFVIWFAYTMGTGKKRESEISGSLLATALCFFVGVGIGLAFQSAEEGDHGSGHDTAAHSTETVDDHDSSSESDHDSGGTHTAALASVEPEELSLPGAPTDASIDQRGGAGLFFSIYYCMTGVHAIHILAGMAVLTWLLVRATKDHFNEEYFGPVDYVGLYWHIVDLIWIYLFPLLYLI